MVCARSLILVVECETNDELPATIVRHERMTGVATELHTVGQGHLIYKKSQGLEKGVVDAIITDGKARRAYNGGSSISRPTLNRRHFWH
jgi:hypothetical protein